MKSIKTKLNIYDFFKILQNKNVTFFSYDDCHDHNVTGCGAIKEDEGFVEKTELEELVMKCGNDEYVLDYENYTGVSFDENDNIIPNSFHFPNEYLVVIL